METDPDALPQPIARMARGWERHPADVARFVFATVVVGALAVITQVAGNTVAAISQDLIHIFDELPTGFLSFLVGFVQLAAVIAPLLVVVVLLARRDRRELTDVIVAAVVASVAIALLQSRILIHAPSVTIRHQRVGSWFVGAAFPSGAYLAGAAAVASVANTWLNRSWRNAAWVGVGVIAGCRLVTATEVPVNLAIVIALGVAVGSAVLALSGAPARRVDEAVVWSALGGSGVPVQNVEPVPDAIGIPLFTATGPRGENYVLKFLGRDERDTYLLIRLWRSASMKGMGDDRPARSPIRAAEYEALTLTLAARGGARVPTFVGIGYTDDGAAVLAEERLDGVRFATLPDDEITDALLTDAWHQVASLRTRAIAHRALTTRNLLALSPQDGGPARAALLGFGEATPHAPERLLAVDVAELLASTALRVGAKRAVACAATVLDSRALGEAAPLLQPVVLTPDTRAQLKGAPALLDELRTLVKQDTHLESVQLAHVHRITVRGAISTVGSIVLAGYLLTLVSNFGRTWDALTRADASAWIALPILVVLGYIGGALSLIGATVIDLPLLRTTEVMFAQSFLNRFTPANSGGMAMRVRYLEREGTDVTVAAASVGLTSAASGLSQVFLIALFFTWGGTSDALGSFHLPRTGSLLLVLIAVAAVVGLATVSGWGRRRVIPVVRRTLGKVAKTFKELAARPRKLVLLFGGSLIGKLATILAFVVSVHALGVHMGFAQAGALYMVAGTVGNAVPTPGGVGGIEAALTASLLGAGVVGATATATVVLFRFVTYWLPTIPGWFFMQRVERHGVV